MQNSVVSSPQGSLLNFCCFEVSAMPQEVLNWRFKQTQGCNSKIAAETSRNVFLSKLKQLTTNSTFSPFHQEVSTILGEQEPKLEVCNKTQGQEICSSGMKPKLMFHQGHFFPSSIPYLKVLMPIFLTLSPTVDTLLLNGSYADSDRDN